MSVELLFQILGLVEFWTHRRMELLPDQEQFRCVNVLNTCLKIV